MPGGEKFQLLKTVAELHSKGVVELSASDRKVIENETQALIRNSMFRRSAANAPDGFEELLPKLKEVDGPDEAYSILVDFLKAEGVIKDDKKEDDSEKKDSPPKADAETDDDSEGKSDDKPDDKPDGKPDGKLDGKPDGKDKDKKEAPKKDKSDEDDSSEKDEEFETAKDDVREELIAMAQRKRAQDKDPDIDKDELVLDKKDGPEDKEKGPKEDGKGPHGPGKGDKGDKGEKLKKLKEKDKEDDKKPSVEEMGVDLSKDQTLRARKSRIVVTADRNIVAHHVDHGPMFIGVPNLDVKKNHQKLIRLANKVKAIIMYEGWGSAAEKCGTKLLLAGVDDDVETTGGDVPPATAPVVDGAESDAREEPDAPKDDVIKELDNDTQEKPNPTTARRRPKRRRPARGRKPARYERVGGVEEDGEVVTVEEPNTTLPANSQQDAENDTDKPDTKPDTSALDNGDIDHVSARKLESRYRKVYKAKAEKAVEEQVTKFARKFVRCMKIASMRMKLNHLPHAFKVAMVDVLADQEGSVEFSDGDSFRGMDQRAAVELTELITAEGHDSFVDDLVKLAADLIQKDDKYLDDVEGDLDNLAPVAPEVEEESSKTSSRKARKARNRMKAGNLSQARIGFPAKTANKDLGIGDVLNVSTRLGRKLKEFGN